MKAQRVAQMQGDVLTHMSHELRTPLNGILGYAQMLQVNGKLDEEQCQWVNIIQHCGEHLLSLINNILDYSKIEADKLELNLDEISLDTFLETIVDINRINAEEKNLIFTCEMDTHLPSVIRADEQRLRQVLLNLLDNAIKFTHHGQVSLRLRFLPPSLVRFEVVDSGIGIDEAHLENIFQPFIQVGEASCHAGTGLGLSICKQLVQLMGGDIKVESRTGHGSLFYFELNAKVI